MLLINLSQKRLIPSFYQVVSPKGGMTPIKIYYDTGFLGTKLMALLVSKIPIIPVD